MDEDKFSDNWITYQKIDFLEQIIQACDIYNNKNDV